MELAGLSSPFFSQHRLDNGKEVDAIFMVTTKAGIMLIWIIGGHLFSQSAMVSPPLRPALIADCKKGIITEQPIPPSYTPLGSRRTREGGRLIKQ